MGYVAGPPIAQGRNQGAKYPKLCNQGRIQGLCGSDPPSPGADPGLCGPDLNSVADPGV
jgi:hypothetical protein